MRIFANHDQTARSVSLAGQRLCAGIAAGAGLVTADEIDAVACGTIAIHRA
jgi:hypothetical protein